MDDATVVLNRPGSTRFVVLSDAIAAGASPTWTEGVAIVREVALFVHNSATPLNIPTLAQITILASGAVETHGGRPHREGPVIALGLLMSDLLERIGCPGQVLEIQRQTQVEPPVFASLQDLHTALEYYARPDQQSVLADYYVRAVVAAEMVTKNRALDELKEKAKSHTDPDEHKNEQPRRRRRWPYIVAALALAAVVAGVSLVMLGGQSSPAVAGSANAAMAAISETSQKVADAAATAITSLVAGSVTAPPPAPVNVSPPPPPPRRPASDVRKAAAPAVVRAPEAATTPTVPAPSPPSPAAEPVADPAPVEIDTSIYTTQHTDVRAPELVYPQLPSRPSTESDGTPPADLELLVLEDGTVGEVRLVPASYRLQDRMMVSAAKAWRFRPAERDGRPVRYRLRIPITW